ncbi:hypothetical protein GGF41_005515, partial [Coemansia sp. RSA 2531]
SAKIKLTVDRIPGISNLSDAPLIIYCNDTVVELNDSTTADMLYQLTNGVNDKLHIKVYRQVNVRLCYPPTDSGNPRDGFKDINAFPNETIASLISKAELTKFTTARYGSDSVGLEKTLDDI